MISEQIASKDNPKIKLYKKLASSKKERIAQGLMCLEGIRLVCDALCSNLIPKLLMADAQGYQHLQERLSDAQLESLKIYQISENLAKSIAETEQTQGVFALFEIPKQNLELTSNGRYLILHSLQDPGNMGMILRTADALGMDGVLLYHCVDLYAPKTIRSSMGAIFRVAVRTYEDFPSLLDDCRKKGIRTYAAVVDADAVPVKKGMFMDGSAVVIGNEGNGIPSEDAALCDEKITISMKGNANSLNAAMAAGLLMWELSGGGCQ